MSASLCGYALVSKGITNDSLELSSKEAIPREMEFPISAPFLAI